METPKNTGPPVTWDESESESNEKWCKVSNNESSESGDSSVVKNLLNQFDDNKDEENYNNLDINLKYSLTDKDGDYDESIFESYGYSVDVIDAMKKMENNNTHCIWSTNSKLTWISWFMDNEIGFKDGISSRQLSTDDVRKLYSKDFRLHSLLPINVENGWWYKRDMWKFFGLGYGGDPKPITVNGTVYYNTPPPKKIIHSKFIDLKGLYPDYGKVLDFDCYGLWLDNGSDIDHYKVYGLFTGDKGLVIRSLQLFVDPLNIIGEINYDKSYWEEYSLESISDQLIRKRIESFMDLLKYMNPETDSSYVESDGLKTTEIEENIIVMARWNDGNFYHARVEHIDDNNGYYVTYIGYDETCRIDKSDIMFRVGNSTEMILHEAKVNVEKAKLEVRKAELQLKNEELRLKRIMYYGE
jgi:hypothetical protein